MTRHFERQIEKLNIMLMRVGTRVEQAVESAVTALETSDGELARKIIEEDEIIDQLEVDVEEECLHALALYQPVASDLRFILSLVKINNELERIGDLAVGLAEETLFLIQEAPDNRGLDELIEAGRIACQMVRQSIESVVQRDVDLAEQVCTSDDRIDSIHRAMYHKVKSELRAHPENAAREVDLLCVSRQIERIADHAVNIAEDVLYTVSGEICRHRNKASRAELASDHEP